MIGMRRWFSYPKIPYWLWLVLLAIILTAPALKALSGLFEKAGLHWPQLKSTLLMVYLANTLIVAAGVGLLSLLLGLVPALILHRYSFLGSGVLPLLLLLPLALPAYITGLSYHALLDYASPTYVFLRNNFDWQSGPYLFFNLHSRAGVILMFSFAYAPYVFLLTRASLKAFNPNLEESARLLGVGYGSILFRLLLPHLRPAIVASLALILMEVLNDYGLVRFFGVETFTTGIFNAWFVLRDSAAAFRLAALLVCFAFVLLVTEQWSRPLMRISQRRSGGQYPPIKLSGWRAALVAFVSSLPFLLGFAIPALNFAAISVNTWSFLLRPDFGLLLLNSLMLALGTGGLATILALMMFFLRHKLKSRLSAAFILFSTSGYALPGAVIAMGMLMVINALAFNAGMSAFMGWLLTGTTIVLIYAYVARFLTASWNSIESGTGNLGRSQLEAAQ